MIRPGFGYALEKERWDLVLDVGKYHDKTGETTKRKFSQGLQLFALVAKEPSIAVYQAKVEASGNYLSAPIIFFTFSISVANEDPAMPLTIDKSFRCYSTKKDMGR